MILQTSKATRFCSTKDHFGEVSKQVWPDIGKINCEAQASLAQRFSVSKYPTMKLVRHSRVARKEYRGQRSVEALASFIRNQMVDSVSLFESIEDLKLKATKRSVIGYFKDESSQEYSVFISVPSIMYTVVSVPLV